MSPSRLNRSGCFRQWNETSVIEPDWWRRIVVYSRRQIAIIRGEQMAQETILVVDDSPTEMRLVLQALSGCGHRIITATDGDQAIELARREQPGVVVLDVVMPGRNGFQVCRTLKGAPETERIPVILLTSRNQESDRFWGLRQGADEYITKPFSESDLQAAVARHL
jgi:twitching motility two-component system response regulator PilH